MNTTLELVGWDDDLTIRKQAVYDLTGRELRLYGYLIIWFDARKPTFPTQDDLAQALDGKDETWSAPTVKRTLAGLVVKGYVKRVRRVKQPSITQVFKSPAPKEPRRITGDPTVGPQVIPQATTIINTQPSIVALFMDNLHGNLNAMDIEKLHDGVKEFSYAVMVKAVSEASGSHGVDKKFLGVNYVLKIAARLAREGDKPKASNGNGTKQPAPREDDPRRFKEFTID